MLFHIDTLRTAAPDKLYRQVTRSKQRNTRSPQQDQTLSDRRLGIVPVEHLEHSSFSAADHSSLTAVVATNFVVIEENHS